jgi:peptidoglycan hydrolase CwlO-like protein
MDAKAALDPIKLEILDLKQEAKAAQRKMNDQESEIKANQDSVKAMDEGIAKLEKSIENEKKKQSGDQR